jgi:hypothetical protein
MPPPAPTLAEIEAIASRAEPIGRNLAITSAYSRLSRAMADIGLDGANWCTFATWASKQAGTTIRREDLGRAIGARVRASADHRPVLAEASRAIAVPLDLVRGVVDEIAPHLAGVDRAADAVARGNLKVFAEIGREFARFLAAVPRGPAALDAFLASLTPGLPPDGQDQLRWAFTHYLEARRGTAPSARAQAMLLGNVRIGLHEQTRLQPEIRAAMDAPVLDVADAKERVAAALDRLPGVARGRTRTSLTRRALDRLAGHLATELTAVARVVTTEHLMTIALPRRVLRLGHDVAGTFPSALAHLTRPDLLATLAPFDATADSVRRSGAVDWSDLSQRLHFIADFFRAYHLEASLFEPPFTTTTQSAIDAGRIPADV